MVLPLIATAARGLITSTAKKAAASKAKSFVSGKGKKKGGALVKQGGSEVTQQTATSIPKEQKVSRVKIPSPSITTSSYVSKPTNGKVSYESIGKTLDNIVGISESLIKVSESELKYSEGKQKALKKQEEKVRAKKREQKLEGDKKKGLSIPSVGLASSSKKGIFDFLTNILVGGIALFLLNNLPKIEKLITDLKESITNPFKLIKSAILGFGMAFSKPLKPLFNAVGNILKGLANKVRTVFSGLGTKIENTLSSVGTKLKNLVGGVIKKAKDVGKAIIKAARLDAAAEAAKQTAKQVGTSIKNVTRPLVAAGKNLVKGGAQLVDDIAKVSFKKVFTPLLKRIPIIGPLIDFAINFFIFKEPLGKAAFKTLGATLFSALGAGIGGPFAPFTAIGGAFLGEWAADKLYEFLFEKGGETDKKEKPKTAAEKRQQVRKKRSTKTDSDETFEKPSGETASPGKYGSLLDFIASGEGGYNSMNQGTQGNRIVGSTGNAKSKIGKNLTDMTIGEIMERQAYLMDKNNPQISDYGIFAAGRYQIIPGTMPGAVKAAGLSMDDMFSPQNQDKLGMALIISKRPKVGDYLSGKSDDIETAMDELANEFASMPDPKTGNSKYGAGNRAAHTVEEVRQALIKARGGASFTPSPSSQTKTSTLKPTSSSVEESLGENTKEDPQTAQVMTNNEGKPNVSALEQQASYEKGGGGVSVIPLPMSQQPSPTGGQSSPPMSRTSTSQILNSYYKAQLLGFLYKQG